MIKLNALLLIFVLNDKILFQFKFILASDATVPKAPGNPVPVHFTVRALPGTLHGLKTSY